MKPILMIVLIILGAVLVLLGAGFFAIWKLVCYVYDD